MVVHGKGRQSDLCKDNITGAAGLTSRLLVRSGGASAPSLFEAEVMNVKIFPLFLCLAGCASSAPESTSSSIRKDMILPVGAVREELRQNQLFLAPVPINEPMPGFPDDYPIHGDADVDICIELLVSSDGAIDDLTQISTAHGCEPARSVASVLLYPEVAAAVKRWTYFGAAICTFESSEDECNTTDAELRAVPVKLAYRFKFRIVDGRRLVRKAER